MIEKYRVNHSLFTAVAPLKLQSYGLFLSRMVGRFFFAEGGVQWD